MRLISFENGGVPGWGALVGEGVIDSARLGTDLPQSLQAFIECCEHAPELLAKAAARTATEPASPMGQRALLPCLPRPGKIVCLGVNYIDHAKEGGNRIGDYPAMFLRCSTSLLAHGAPLQVPRISDKLDYEAELALVIGRRARFVTEAQALDHVFGYACFNDASLRDYQRRTTQWTIGKNFDATGAFGPALVSADELPSGCVGLRIQSRLNGAVMQDANTADMAFGVARTISLLSECMTLEPGDVIAMGTPGGVGYARTPPVWMKAGDTIEIEVEGIGVLRNVVASSS